MVNIRKIACPSDKLKIKCPYAMKPTRIVIHNIANDASAADLSIINYRYEAVADK